MNASGVLNVGTLDGTLSPTVRVSTVANGNFETAVNGTGAFNLYSGTLSLERSNFITGQATGSVARVRIGGGAAIATLDLAGGDGNRDWNTNRGTGTVNVRAKGLVSVGRNLNLGNYAAVPGGLALTIDGGAVYLGQGGTNNVGNLNFRNGGSQDQVNLVGGTLASTGGALNFHDASAAQLQWTGGTLAHFGSVNGSPLVQQGGVLQVGAAGSSATMNINAGYTNLAGTVEMDILGANPGSGYDQLRIQGGVTLAGPLVVNLGVPQSHGSITLIDNLGPDPVNGTFAGLPEGATVTAGGGQYTISYVGGTGNDVVLQSPELRVAPPQALPGGQVRLRFSGFPLTSYTVQYADNTVPVPHAWVDIGTVTSDATGQVVVDRIPATLSELYRVRVP